MADAVTSSPPPVSPAPSSGASVTSVNSEEMNSGFLGAFARRKSTPSANRDLQESPSMTRLLNALTRKRLPRAKTTIAATTVSKPAKTEEKGNEATKPAAAKPTATKTAVGAKPVKSVKAKDNPKVSEELKKAKEKITELQAEVEDRAAVMRRRAVQMTQDADKIQGLEWAVKEAEGRAEKATKRVEELETRVEELETTAVKLAAAQKERIDDLETQITVKDKTIHERRPRPLQRAANSLLLASTGAIVAMVSLQ